MGQARFSHRPLVPLLLHLILPLLPLASVAFADGFLAIGNATRERLVAVDAFFARGGERGNRQRTVAQHAVIPVVMLVVVGGPLADLDIGEADIDPFAVGRRRHLNFAGLGVQLMRAASPVDDVESGDQVDAVEGVVVEADAERMLVGETQPLVDVIDRRADGFGELDGGAKAHGHARGVFGQQQRIVRRHQHVGGVVDGRLLGGDAGRHLDMKIRHRDIFRQLGFLHRRVVDHVYRPLRLAHHDRVGARERIRHAVNAAGLIVPLGEAAHDVALGEGGVNPVDKRPAQLLVHGTGGADDEHRTAVDIGVVDAHGSVQQADDVMDDGDHWFAGGFGIAMGDLHGDLFMVAQAASPACSHRS